MNHICTFCQKECKDISPKVQQSDVDWELPSYHACKICNVGYQLTYDDKLEFTRFYASLKDKIYCLDLYHQHQETHILYLPPDINDTIVSVYSFPYLVQGITPYNCQFKIETYITFS